MEMEVGFIILMALAIPIVVIWPLLIWAGALKSIYQLVRNRVRGKATVAEKTTRS
jgi:hypothetical protein